MRNRPVLNVHDRRSVLLWVWVIFAVALGLRISNIGEYPPRHATDDEFHYMWAGLNFWHRGVPEAWSGLAGANRIGVAGFDETGYVMVSPALDHPPLFSLYAGAMAQLTNPERLVSKSPLGHFLVIWDVNLHLARWMMVPIFVATFWLLFAVARRGFGDGIALLTVLIYGLMSHAVAHGRLILADNLSAVWLLLGVWAVMAELQGAVSTKKMRVLVVVSTALALLTKVPAVCQVPVLMALFIYHRRYREIAFVVAGLLVGGAVYLGWVSYFGLDGFIRVMQAQAARFRGFNAFHLITGTPRLLDQIDLNGVLVAGWFCALAQVLRPRIHPLMLILPVYLLAFTFFVGDVVYGWYSIPMYPWLALAVALTTAQVYRRPEMGMTLGWLVLFLPWAFQTVYLSDASWGVQFRLPYVGLVALLLGALALPVGQRVRIVRVAIGLILALTLFRESLYVNNVPSHRPTDQSRYF